MIVGHYSQDIFQRRLKQVFELFLGNELEQGGFEWISSNVVEEFHERLKITTSN